MITWRRLWIWLPLACAAEGLLVGCESGHSLGLRSKGGSPPRVAAASDEEGVVSAEESEATKRILKPTRRPAALSSEARDIEDSLGLGRN